MERETKDAVSPAQEVTQLKQKDEHEREEKKTTASRRFLNPFFSLSDLLLLHF